MSCKMYMKKYITGGILCPISKTVDLLHGQIFEWCLVGFTNPVKLICDYWLSKSMVVKVKQLYTYLQCSRQNVDDVRLNTY